MSMLEGVRIITGIPLAILLPLTITWLSLDIVHSMVTTSLYGAYVSLPMFPEWRFWLLVAIVPIFHLVIRFITNTQHARVTGRDRWIAIHTRRQSIGVVVTLFATIIVSVLLSRGPSGLQAVLGFMLDDKAAVVLNGGLGAVFIGGVVVALIVKPIAAASEGSAISVPRLLQVGAHVGHIERLLFFIFIVGGASSAAALALTAKSLVRLPSVSDDINHAEYYLVGTLSSAAICLVAAVGTRLALGLAPL